MRDELGGTSEERGEIRNERGEMRNERGEVSLVVGVSPTTRNLSQVLAQRDL
jgi:hypothetical protein